MKQMLLIEGHKLIRGELKQMLANGNGSKIAEAVDPIEGVDQALSLRPDVIILDTTWTEINGFWLARLLRRLAPQSKLVLLLDDNHLDYQEAARINGADAFVAKHLLTTELLPILAQWEQSRELESPSSAAA